MSTSMELKVSQLDRHFVLADRQWSHYLCVDWASTVSGPCTPLTDPCTAVLTVSISE